ncbi:hypothetical protein BDZ85DRAFT_262261 [Elsinoe ampelina]|uniref:Uncharacterized protein n=1 Tax=Elsinoe ampelina TaxID=302913 RepID=A0A6A6GDW7_9PEZI|nr:hypothetical protein BDZ85DRAFT_262261 [Elsinoe ampelina]
MLLAFYQTFSTGSCTQGRHQRTIITTNLQSRRKGRDRSRQAQQGGKQRSTHAETIKTSKARVKSICRCKISNSVCEVDLSQKTRATSRVAQRYINTDRGRPQR